MTEKQRCQDTQGRSSCEDRGRDCSDASISQRTLRIVDNHQRLGRSKLGLAPRSFQRKHSLIEHLDFGLLDSRIIKEHMSNELSHPLCGTLLQPPWETIIPTEDTSCQIYLSFFTELLEQKAVVVYCKSSLARSSKIYQGIDPWSHATAWLGSASPGPDGLSQRDNIFSKDSSTCFHAVGVNVRSKGETPLCG